MSIHTEYISPCTCDFSDDDFPVICDTCYDAQWAAESEQAWAEAEADAIMAQYDYPDYF